MVLVDVWRRIEHPFTYALFHDLSYGHLWQRARIDPFYLLQLH